MLNVADVVCFVCFSCPSASPEFEGRGAELLNLELAQTLERMMKNSSAIDLKSLCLIPKLQCWVVYVDVLVLIFSILYHPTTFVVDSILLYLSCWTLMETYSMPFRLEQELLCSIPS